MTPSLLPVCMPCDECATPLVSPAYILIHGLVVRRLWKCPACLQRHFDERRAAGLPPMMVGMWPIDFAPMRENLPDWVDGASARERTELGERIEEVLEYFGQEWPSGYEREK